MSPSDLIQLLEDKHQEYRILNVLMFNNLSFTFLPIINPKVFLHNTNRAAFELIGFDGVNLFSTNDIVPTFKLTKDILEAKIFKKCILHPEHIYAYAIRTNDLIGIELIYTRGQNFARQIRNYAFLSFLNFNPVSSIDEFQRVYEESLVIQKNYTKGAGRKDLLRLVFDKALYHSIIRESIGLNEFENSYALRLHSALQECFNNRDALIQLSSSVSETLVFTGEYSSITHIFTPLDKDISIVDERDDISNILFRLAHDLKATRLYIATGYMFESGLTSLTSALFCIKRSPDTMVELLVGDLYKYISGGKVRTPNRATAEKINALLSANTVDKLYTYPNKFYHGKFYYIANQEIGYVITGSSNVSLSAFQSNRELDVIFRFEHKDGYSTLEKEFIVWYDSIKGQCVELKELDPNMFPSNLFIDEAGNSYSTSILKTIPSEEEKARFQFLESFSPSKVETNLFKGKAYRPFKGYMLFLFPDSGVSVLEGFSYGNSCYVFSTNNVEHVKQLLASKSKEEVRNLEEFITSINHDERYQEEIRLFFSRRRLVST